MRVDVNQTSCDGIVLCESVHQGYASSLNINLSQTDWSKMKQDTKLVKNKVRLCKIFVLNCILSLRCARRLAHNSKGIQQRKEPWCRRSPKAMDSLFEKITSPRKGVASQIRVQQFMMKAANKHQSLGHRLDSLKLLRPQNVRPKQRIERLSRQ